MLGRYAYSFDRETFTGQIRNAHRAAAGRHLPEPGNCPISPTEIYVGLNISGDPQASGHAQPVLQRMSDRARAASDNAPRYLQGTGEQAEAELDAALEQTIQSPG